MAKKARKRRQKQKQPATIVDRQLSANNRKDRIRKVFGLTADDPLPDVDEEHLDCYFDFLAEGLSFPFEARFRFPNERFEITELPIEVLDLYIPDDGGQDEGLLCEVAQDDDTLTLPLCAVEKIADKHNRQLIADYSYWFCNYPSATVSDASDPESPFVMSDQTPRSPTQMILRSLRGCGLYGGIYGVLLGILLAAVEQSRTGAGVGAFLLGLLGLLLGLRYGKYFGAVNQLQFGPIIGGIFGAVLGALAGALIGATLVALVGAHAGVVIGGLLGGLIGYLGKEVRSRIGATVLMGACLGAFLQILVEQTQQALFGAAWGVVIGGVSGILLFVAVVGALKIVAR